MPWLATTLSWLMAPDDSARFGIDLEARAAQLVMRIERAEDIAFVVGGEEQS